MHSNRHIVCHMYVPALTCCLASHAYSRLHISRQVHMHTRYTRGGVCERTHTSRYPHSHPHCSLFSHHPFVPTICSGLLPPLPSLAACLLPANLPNLAQSAADCAFPPEPKHPRPVMHSRRAGRPGKRQHRALGHSASAAEHGLGRRVTVPCPAWLAGT